METMSKDINCRVSSARLNGERREWRSPQGLPLAAVAAGGESERIRVSMTLAHRAMVKQQRYRAAVKDCTVLVSPLQAQAAVQRYAEKQRVQVRVVVWAANANCLYCLPHAAMKVCGRSAPPQHNAMNLHPDWS